MAITKIKPVKSWLRDAIEYITDKGKTDGKMLISTYRCSYETACEEFMLTLRKSRDGGKVRAHHLIQAFKPGEATPELAHEIGKRLAKAVTKGKHEYILTTHIDKGHIHNHVIFCAADYENGKKYKSNRQTLKGIRRLSDDLCEEYGLSTIAETKGRGKHYSEYMADRSGGGSHKSKLRKAIDTLIPQAEDIDDLIKRLKQNGYEVKLDRFIKVRASGWKYFINTKTLGNDYTEENLKRRIAGEYVPAYKRKTYKYTDFIFYEPEGNIDVTGGSTGISVAPTPYVRSKPDVNLIVDLENCIKTQQSAGFAHWQKIQNLKEAARTLNFLTENDLLRSGDLDARRSEVKAEFDKTQKALKAAEKKLSGMGNLIKQMENYRRTKAVYAQYVKLSGKKKEMYRKEHEADIIIHEAAYRQIRPYAGADGLLPSLTALKQKYSQLSAKKDALRSEYGKLKQQAYTYDNVKRNVDSILDISAGREQTKKRGVER